MTRRSLFTLLGLSWLPPEPALNLLNGTVTIPSDGDPAIMEQVNVALRELMENSVNSTVPVLPSHWEVRILVTGEVCEITCDIKVAA